MFDWTDPSLGNCSYLDTCRNMRKWVPKRCCGCCGCCRCCSFLTICGRLQSVLGSAWVGHLIQRHAIQVLPMLQMLQVLLS